MLRQATWVALCVGLAALFLAVGSSSQPFDAEVEKAAVAKVINSNVTWFKDKDFDLLFSGYTNGPDLFMYQLDTASTIRGFDELKKYSVGWRNPDVRYAGHIFHELSIHLSQAGDAAWFEAGLEDCAQLKDRPARCFTTRLTGVLEKRAGRWVIVQQHFSLPAEKVAEDWAARTAHPPTRPAAVTEVGSGGGAGK